MQISREFLNVPLDKIKFPVRKDPSHVWNAVLLGGRNSFLRNSLQLRGNLQVKIRQLNKIGYRVTVVSFLYWTF